MSYSDMSPRNFFYEDFDDESMVPQNSSQLNPVQDEKKRIHNELERKRRGNIKENFDMLFEVVPVDEHEKSSRAQILHSTVRHINKMNTLIQKSESYNAKLTQDIKALEDELNRLTKMKSTGDTPEISNYVQKIIVEARTSAVPDFSNVTVDECSRKILTDSSQDTHSVSSKKNYSESNQVHRLMYDTNANMDSSFSQGEYSNRSHSINMNNKNHHGRFYEHQYYHTQPPTNSPSGSSNGPTYSHDNNLLGIVRMEHNYEGSFYPPPSSRISGTTMASIPSALSFNNQIKQNYPGLPLLQPSVNNNNRSGNGTSSSYEDESYGYLD